MEQQGVSEPEAYQATRRLAMLKNKTISEIAESVVAEAELLHA